MCRYSEIQIVYGGIRQASGNKSITGTLYAGFSAWNIVLAVNIAVCRERQFKSLVEKVKHRKFLTSILFGSLRLGGYEGLMNEGLLVMLCCDPTNSPSMRCAVFWSCYSVLL